MVVCKVDVRPCDFYGRTMAARGCFASAGEVTPTLYRLRLYLVRLYAVKLDAAVRVKKESLSSSRT